MGYRPSLTSSADGVKDGLECPTTNIGWLKSNLAYFKGRGVPCYEKEADPQLAMGPLGEDFGDFRYLWSEGLPGLIPGRTNYERAWIGPGIPLHGFSAQP